MPLSSQQLQLIHDNPNLSGAALSRLIGVSRWVINEIRDKPKWTHNGKGIPFVGFSKSSGQYKVRCKRRDIYKGGFNDCIENLDRLIFCLENNNGKLPRTLNDVVFGDLEFINSKEKQ